MSEDVTAGAWTEAKPKAIPVGRDRMQSLVLVWIAVPVLGYLVFEVVQQLFIAGGYPRTDLTKAVPISLVFALAAWRVRAATAMAALCGGMICLILTEPFQRILITCIAPWRPVPSILHSGLTLLVLLFLLTFGATRLGRKVKADAGLEECRKGRSASQIVANLGIAALMASFWGDSIYQLAEGGYSFSGPPGNFARFTAVWLVPTLAALAEATADTVSSEIGQAFGGAPVMLTTLRRVAPGTDGAVTVMGTVAGVVAAAVIAATGMPALGMSAAECGVAFGAGVAGLFFDSLLGATVERKGWLGNDLVNFASTAFSAGVALVAIRLGGDGLVR
jgi:uncharacterized membrane protein